MSALTHVNSRATFTVFGWRTHKERHPKDGNGAGQKQATSTLATAANVGNSPILLKTPLPEKRLAFLEHRSHESDFYKPRFQKDQSAG